MKAWLWLVLEPWQRNRKLTIKYIYIFSVEPLQCAYVWRSPPKVKILKRCRAPLVIIKLYGSLAGHRPESMSQMKKNVVMHVTCVQVCDGDIPDCDM